MFVQYNFKEQRLAHDDTHVELTITKMPYESIDNYGNAQYRVNGKDKNGNTVYAVIEKDEADAINKVNCKTLHFIINDKVLVLDKNHSIFFFPKYSSVLLDDSVSEGICLIKKEQKEKNEKEDEDFRSNFVMRVLNVRLLAAGYRKQVVAYRDKRTNRIFIGENSIDFRLRKINWADHHFDVLDGKNWDEIIVHLEHLSLVKPYELKRALD